MWHKRNTRIQRTVAGLAFAALSAASCVPDSPESGAPTHPTDRYSVTLEWDAPTEDAVGRTLEDLAGYRLYYTPESGTEAEADMIEVGAETRFTVTGLEAGSYIFAVTALDLDGNESDFSDPLPVEVGP